MNGRFCRRYVPCGVANSLLADSCRKVSTGAFLLFPQRRGWNDSTVDIETHAVQAGGASSKLRLPPAQRDHRD
jgi:hypothetical protein